jgi:DNA primase
MFPIHDLRGDPVGFGGRRIEDIDRSQTNNPDAKYVNSADSVVYHKAQLLFGLDRARREITDDRPAVVVEGYTDVIAMHLAGVKTAVATCGTALGEGHFDLLRRFGERVVLAFDSDEAGSKAALRGDELESPFRLDLDLRVADMPDGLDPADLVQQGRADELAESVKTARPLLERRIEHEVARHDRTPEGRARALATAVAHLRKIESPSVREGYVEFTAYQVGVDPAIVRDAVRGRDVSREFVPDPARPLDRLEAAVLRVALDSPAFMAELTPEDFDDERLRAAFLAASERAGSSSIDVAAVTESSARSVLFQLAVDQTPMPDADELMARLHERRLDREIERIQGELDDQTEGSEAHSDNLRRLIALQQEKRSSSRL